MPSTYERPYHPIDLTEEAAAVFPLGRMIEDLLEEEVYQTSERDALTLVHDDGLSVVLTVAKKGAECGEHTSPEPALIISLRGEVAIKGASDAGIVYVPKDSAAALAPGVPHKLEAISDCAYLTIIGSRSE
jgi:quercetin dioxygenase-like cupin family protein